MHTATPCQFAKRVRGDHPIHTDQLSDPSCAKPQVSLGYSTSETGAAQIYDREALRLRGSAAQLNFPDWSLSDAAGATTAPLQDPQVRWLR